MMDMKTMKNIFNILLLGLMVTTVCSCNDEIEYSPGEPSPFAESKVFFSKDNAYDLILGVYDTEVTFFLERTDASSALSVPLEASGYDQNVFTVPASVEFAAGETKKEVKIQVKNMEVFTDYSLKKIAIPSELVNPYKDFSAISLNVLKEDYVPFAKGMYTSNFFGDEWEMVLEYSALLDLYRFQDLYVEGYDFLFKWDGGETMTMQPANIETGYVHPSYGMVTAKTVATKYFADSETLAFQYNWTVSAGSFGSYTEYFEMTEKY